MKNELLRIDYTNVDRPTVLGRDLHEALEVQTPYNKWFSRMCEYGFADGCDYMTVDKNVCRADGVIMPQVQHDHQLTISMAKELCMLQRTQKGKECREYFIKVEEAWNKPEIVLSRALIMANNSLQELRSDNAQLLAENAVMKPKAEFADRVANTDGLLSMSNFAKVIQDEHINMGRNKLFEWLRSQGYLRGNNEPYQQYVNQGLFRVRETVHNGGLRTQTYVTGKGQLYLVEKLKAEFCAA
nr:MAG TPA: KilAC domain protein [Caudoviricetes sp.]